MMQTCVKNNVFCLLFQACWFLQLVSLINEYLQTSILIFFLKLMWLKIHETHYFPSFLTTLFSNSHLGVSPDDFSKDCSTKPSLLLFGGSLSNKCRDEHAKMQLQRIAVSRQCSKKTQSHDTPGNTDRREHKLRGVCKKVEMKLPQ